MARKQIIRYQAFFYREDGSHEGFESIETKQISKARKHVQKFIDGELTFDNWYEHFENVAYIELYMLYKGSNGMPYFSELREVIKVK